MAAANGVWMAGWGPGGRRDGPRHAGAPGDDEGTLRGPKPARAVPVQRQYTLVCHAMRWRAGIPRRAGWWRQAVEMHGVVMGLIALTAEE
jgi:hypothetical protein